MNPAGVHLASRRKSMKYGPEITKRICDAIIEGDTYKTAAEKAGIYDKTFYRWMNEKSDFCDAIKRAREEMLDRIADEKRAECVRKAYDVAFGYEFDETRTETTYDKNGKPHERKTITRKTWKPDTEMLKFLLTNDMPHRYKNRQNVEENIKQEIQNKPDLSAIPDDLLEAVLQSLKG